MNTQVDTSRVSMIGQHVGNYIVERALGAGGMGSVWVGKHRHTGRLAAIKVILAEQLGNEQIVRRFEREARVVVEHDNVAQVLDAGRLADGRFYIALEYIDGASLESVCNSNGKLAADRASHFGAQIGAGLEALHRAGFIHRDIKPENVLVTRGSKERIKIIDFGFAKPIGQPSAELMPGMTREMIGAGTPSYMPPEQFINFAGVDVRADVYSLAMTYFRMVTGRTAHLAPDPEGQMKARLDEQFEPRNVLERDARHLSGASMDAIMRGLAYQREARWQRERDLVLAFADGFENGRRQVYAVASDFEEHAGATDETVKHSERTMPARALIGSPPPAGRPISSGPSVAIGEQRATPSPAPRRRSGRMALIVALGVGAIAATIAIVVADGSHDTSGETPAPSTDLTPSPSRHSAATPSRPIPTPAPAPPPPAPAPTTTGATTPAAVPATSSPTVPSSTQPQPAPVAVSASASQAPTPVPPPSASPSATRGPRPHKVLAAPPKTNAADSHAFDLDHPMGPQ